MYRIVKRIAYWVLAGTYAALAAGLLAKETAAGAAAVAYSLLAAGRCASRPASGGSARSLGQATRAARRKPGAKPARPPWTRHCKFLH
jgi:hypothetical protein